MCSSDLLFVMKRTEAKISAALFLQTHITGNHIHNIIGRTNLFNQFIWIIRHPCSFPFIHVRRFGVQYSRMKSLRLINLPRLRHKILLKFCYGIAVCHSCNIITDHPFPFFSLFQHQKILFGKAVDMLIIIVKQPVQ